MKREKGERRKKIGTTRQNTVEEGIFLKKYLQVHIKTKIHVQKILSNELS